VAWLVREAWRPGSKKGKECLEPLGTLDLAPRPSSCSILFYASVGVRERDVAARNMMGSDFSTTVFFLEREIVNTWWVWNPIGGTSHAVMPVNSEMRLGSEGQCAKRAGIPKTDHTYFMTRRAEQTA
jgi:hypothetical protein